MKAVCSKAHVSPEALSLFLHGTTVATNAVLAQKIARVGIIVTDG
jgi:N-methylhydantoinase A